MGQQREKERTYIFFKGYLLLFNNRGHHLEQYVCLFSLILPATGWKRWVSTLESTAALVSISHYLLIYCLIFTALQNEKITLYGHKLWPEVLMRRNLLFYFNAFETSESIKNILVKVTGWKASSLSSSRVLLLNFEVEHMIL